MRYPGNVVTESDTRSAGAGMPTKCYYCSGVPGGPHDDSCVCIDRPVKISVTLELIVAVARSWTQEDIEGHRNDSSWCADNITNDIERHMGDGKCLCNRFSASYVGEATIEEAQSVGLNLDTEDD